MGPEPPRPPLSRATVVAEARAIIAEEGLDAVSFRHLAHRLGVTAPALYAYVTDKDDLLRSVTASEIETIIAGLGPAGDDPVETVRRFCRRYVDHATANPALYRTMFRYPPWGAGADGDYAPGEPGLPLAGWRFEAPLDAVRRAVRAGAFRPQRPFVALLTLWTAVHGLAEALLLGVPLDPAERDAFADHVIDTAIRGLLADGPAPAGAPDQPTA